MKLKLGRGIILIIALTVVVTMVVIGGGAVALKSTNDTEFCVSCHTMQIPYEEYQSSVHFSNSKGIRAGCSDCHVSPDPVDYMVAKIRASKDVFHHFVTGKIDTEEKFEEHRLAMAETVWKQLKANDSATCRSCHDFEAMDWFEQSEDAAKIHEYAQQNDKTCIDCHKGVAHFPPTLKVDNKLLDELIALSAKTSANEEVVYPVEDVLFGEFGVIEKATKLTVNNVGELPRKVTLEGYQKQGTENVIYQAKGQRIVLANLNDNGIKSAEFGEYSVDEYGENWRKVTLKGPIEGNTLGDVKPLWDYAKEVDKTYCSSCHGLVPAKNYTVNSWGNIARAMGARTDISENELSVLIKYFQFNAKDFN